MSEGRPFEVCCEGRRVPGFVWSAPHERRRPLVLLGHGGGSDAAAMEPLAGLLVEHLGVVVAAVDGPVHGARRCDAAGRERVLDDFRALWRGGTPRIDEMVADWRAALDHLGVRADVDPRRVAWAGVSMGTAYGLPFVAAEPRVTAAVLGSWGLSYPSSQRLADDAPQVRCPVLFQQKVDDELFSAEGQERLFALIGSPCKRRVRYPGTHAAPVVAQLADALAFLSAQLG